MHSARSNVDYEASKRARPVINYHPISDRLKPFKTKDLLQSHALRVKRQDPTGVASKVVAWQLETRDAIKTAHENEEVVLLQAKRRPRASLPAKLSREHGFMHYQIEDENETFMHDMWRRNRQREVVRRRNDAEVQRALDTWQEHKNMLNAAIERKIEAKRRSFTQTASTATYLQNTIRDVFTPPQPTEEMLAAIGTGMRTRPRPASASVIRRTKAPTAQSGLVPTSAWTGNNSVEPEPREEKYIASKRAIASDPATRAALTITVDEEASEGGGTPTDTSYGAEPSERRRENRLSVPVVVPKQQDTSSREVLPPFRFKYSPPKGLDEKRRQWATKRPTKPSPVASKDSEDVEARRVVYGWDASEKPQATELTAHTRQTPSAIKALGPKPGSSQWSAPQRTAPNEAWKASHPSRPKLRTAAVTKGTAGKGKAKPSARKSTTKAAPTKKAAAPAKAPSRPTSARPSSRPSSAVAGRRLNDAKQAPARPQSAVVRPPPEPEPELPPSAIRREQLEEVQKIMEAFKKCGLTISESALNKALVRTDDKPAAVVASAMAGPYTGLPSDPMLAAKAELEQERKRLLKQTKRPKSAGATRRRPGSRSSSRPSSGRPGSRR